jgi:hypothetical protein
VFSEGPMGTSAKLVVAFLFFLNVLAVCMGYVGIAKLERYNADPFYNEGLHTFAYAAKFVSDGTILFWHSWWGGALIWAGTLILPLIAAVLIFSRERLLTGTALLMLSFLVSGVTGFLIWFHAYVDLPHEW